MSSTVSTQYNPGPTFSGTVGSASLVGKEGYGVKQHTDGTIILCATKGEAGYVLVTGGAVGAQVTYMVPSCGGECPLIVNGAVSGYGTKLAVQTTGKFAAAADKEYIFGFNIDLATADLDFVRANLVGYSATA